MSILICQNEANVYSGAVGCRASLHPTDWSLSQVNTLSISAQQKTRTSQIWPAFFLTQTERETVIVITPRHKIQSENKNVPNFLNTAVCVLTPHPTQTKLFFCQLEFPMRCVFCRAALRPGPFGCKHSPKKSKWNWSQAEFRPGPLRFGLLTESFFFWTDSGDHINLPILFPFLVTQPLELESGQRAWEFFCHVLLYFGTSLTCQMSFLSEEQQQQCSSICQTGCLLPETLLCLEIAQLVTIDTHFDFVPGYFGTCESSTWKRHVSRQKHLAKSMPK